ncbi:MAG: AmmeMemoRadiSam system protein B, partial [Candidatus Omnitrophota bacterium]
MIREPAVAGQFYSGLEKALRNDIKDYVDMSQEKTDAIGALSPHAGYACSGLVAGKVLSAIKPRSTYIIMGPNHTGLGFPFSVTACDSWKTPLGEVKIDTSLVSALKKSTDLITESEDAHQFEHSIEVQLPFLQFMHKGSFKFVPIVISQSDLSTYKKLGNSLASTIKDLKLEKDVTIIASSDMTHYEPQEDANKKDSAAIKAMLNMNEDELFKVIEKFDISMCGYAPAIIMLVAAKALG